MCNRTGIDFGRRMIVADMVAGREVIDVGALDVNGSLRSVIEAFGPARYVGVDLTDGPGVDAVVDASELISRFGLEAFDLVISTEMVEHTRDWPTVFHNLKGVMRPGAYLLVTTRSPGFPFHAWPYDFWRYEPDDMRAILGDLEILTIESDTASPGVFVLARRPEVYAERTPHVPLVSIITGRREREVTDRQVAWFRARYRVVRWLRIAQARKLATAMWARVRKALVRGRNRAWRGLPLSIRSMVKRLAGRAA